MPTKIKVEIFKFEKIIAKYSNCITLICNGCIQTHFHQRGNKRMSKSPDSWRSITLTAVIVLRVSGTSCWASPWLLTRGLQTKLIRKKTVHSLNCQDFCAISVKFQDGEDCTQRLLVRVTSCKWGQLRDFVNFDQEISSCQENRINSDYYYKPGIENLY